MKRLSAAKYGRPRAAVEKEIFDRLGSADREKQSRLDAMKKRQAGMSAPAAGGAKGGSSFLDDWLAKRQQLAGRASTPKAPTATATSGPVQSQGFGSQSTAMPIQKEGPMPTAEVPQSAPTQVQQDIPPTQTSGDDVAEQVSKLQLRGDSQNHDDEVAIKLQR